MAQEIILFETTNLLSSYLHCPFYDFDIEKYKENVLINL